MWKRSFDLTGALLGLLLGAPVLLALAALCRIVLGRPVVYRQTRIGLRERPFTFYKFRTMTDARDAQGRLLPDSERLTPFGRFLRQTSLDELPQLWNVVRGDMSLVGPRPLLPEYLPRYNARQRRRHQVRPGITGWAQVHGRNGLSWEEKFELDVFYVERRSFRLDVKILWLTMVALARRDGISQPGHASMPQFLGTAE
jgi:sugar transferase EpsL